MATESIWICDKCGAKGDKNVIPGAVDAIRGGTGQWFIHFDLCIPCLLEVETFFESFMNPKREYPTEKEATAKKKD